MADRRAFRDQRPLLDRTWPGEKSRLTTGDCLAHVPGESRASRCSVGESRYSSTSSGNRGWRHSSRQKRGNRLLPRFRIPTIQKQPKETRPNPPTDDGGCSNRGSTDVLNPPLHTPTKSWDRSTKMTCSRHLLLVDANINKEVLDKLRGVLEGADRTVQVVHETAAVLLLSFCPP